MPSQPPAFPPSRQTTTHPFPLTTRIQNVTKEIRKHPTRREVSSWRVLEAICVEFIGKTPLWPWLWPVKALCAHFHHLMTAQIMPTTASGVQSRKIMNNKCSSECRQRISKRFHEQLKREVDSLPTFRMIFTQRTKTALPPWDQFTTKPFSN